MKVTIGFIEMFLMVLLGLVLFYAVCAMAWLYPAFQITLGIIIGFYALVALVGEIYEKKNNGR